MFSLSSLLMATMATFFDGVCRAATPPALPVEECFRELALALSASRARVPGGCGALVPLIGSRGVPLDRVSLPVALFLASFGTVPPLRLLANELPRDTDAVATQLLPELGGARVGDKDHGHDLLLCDVIEVTLIRDVQDPVRVRDHAFPLLLREFE